MKRKKLPTKDKTVKAEVILDQITCPVCFFYVLPPMRQCLNGHLICSNCVPQLKGKCCVCRVKLLNMPRNRAMEKVAEHILIQCNSWDCFEYLSPLQMVKHYRECSQADVDCRCTISNECSWSGPVKNFFAHAASVHEKVVIKLRGPSDDVIMRRDSDDVRNYCIAVQCYKGNYVIITCERFENDCCYINAFSVEKKSDDPMLNTLTVAEEEADYEADVDTDTDTNKGTSTDMNWKPTGVDMKWAPAFKHEWIHDFKYSFIFKGTIKITSSITKKDTIDHLNLSI